MLSIGCADQGHPFSPFERIGMLLFLCSLTSLRLCFAICYRAGCRGLFFLDRTIYFLVCRHRSFFCHKNSSVVFFSWRVSKLVTSASKQEGCFLYHRTARARAPSSRGIGWNSGNTSTHGKVGCAAAGSKSDLHLIEGKCVFDSSKL